MIKQNKGNNYNVKWKWLWFLLTKSEALLILFWSVARIHNGRECKMLVLCKKDVTFPPQVNETLNSFSVWFGICRSRKKKNKQPYSSHGEYVLEVTVQGWCSCSRKNQGFRFLLSCSDILNMWLLSSWLQNGCGSSRHCYCISVRNKREEEEEKGMC